MTGRKSIFVSVLVILITTNALGQGINFPQGNLTASITNTTPYVGQEIVYKFVISDFINVETQPEYIKPSFENFWVNPDIGYVVDDNHIVWETLIVPLQEGSVTIAPGQLKFGARADQASYQLESNSIELFVQPLPEGAPVEFNGAVGEFDLRALMNSQNITLGNYLELSVILGGRGNLGIIDAPIVVFPDDWVVVQGDPKVTANQRIDVVYDPTRAGITEGIKEYTWYIQFPDIGFYSIPSVTFAYFNPTLHQYQVIGTQVISVEVIPSTNLNSQSQLSAIQSDLLHTYNWGKPFVLNVPYNSLGQFLVWGVGAVIFVIGMIMTIRSLSKPTRKDHSTSLYHLTRQTIANHTQSPTSESIRYINQALHVYLSERLSTNTNSLTLVELQTLLNKSGVDERTAIIFIEQLHTSEMWRFTPTATIDTEKYAKQIVYLLSRIEQMIV